MVGEIGRIIGELHEEEGRYATRFGGDEYQTILPGLSREEALEVAEEIRAADEALYRAKRLGGNTVSE